MDNNKLRAKRVLKRISQEELAYAAKVSRSYISQIENGKKQPSLSVLERIAKVLGCKVKDFF